MEHDSFENAVGGTSRSMKSDAQMPRPQLNPLAASWESAARKLQEATTVQHRITPARPLRYSHGTPPHYERDNVCGGPRVRQHQYRQQGTAFSQEDAVMMTTYSYSAWATPPQRPWKEATRAPGGQAVQETQEQPCSSMNYRYPHGYGLVSVNGTLPKPRKRTSDSIRDEFSLSKEQPLKKSEGVFPACLDL